MYALTFYSTFTILTLYDILTYYTTCTLYMYKCIIYITDIMEQYLC